MDAEQQTQDNPVAAPGHPEVDLERAFEQYTAATSAEATLALRAVLDAVVDRGNTAQTTSEDPAAGRPGSENARAVFARLGSAPTK